MTRTTKIATLITMALILGLASCPPQQPVEISVAPKTNQAEIELINKAETELSAGNFETARAKAFEFIKTYPASDKVPDARYVVALSLLREGRENEARAELEKLIKTYPQSAHTAEAAATLRTLEMRRLQEISALRTERQRAALEKAKLIEETAKDLRLTVAKQRVYVVLDLYHNVVMLKMGTATLYAFPAATGKGWGYLSTIGKAIEFKTPIGKHTVKTKNKDPIWYRPNWYWLERGEEVPEGITGDERSMMDHLGAFSIGIGDGIYFHGFEGDVKPGKYTHGCIRMNTGDLEIFFNLVEVGTEVYIF